MGPNKIIFIRHGEKTADATDPNLSPAGYTRAAALPGYFASNVAVFGKIGGVFACEPKDPGSSMRAVETITPLATSLGLTINEGKHWEHEGKSHIVNQCVNGVNEQGEPAKSSQSDMAKEILKDSKYHDKSVVICWEHHTLPDLIVSAGGPIVFEWSEPNVAADNYSIGWGDVFDRVVVVDYHHGKMTGVVEYKQYDVVPVVPSYYAAVKADDVETEATAKVGTVN